MKPYSLIPIITFTFSFMGYTAMGTESVPLRPIPAYQVPGGPPSMRKKQRIENMNNNSRVSYLLGHFNIKFNDEDMRKIQIDRVIFKEDMFNDPLKQTLGFRLTNIGYSSQYQQFLQENLVLRSSDYDKISQCPSSLYGMTFEGADGEEIFVQICY